MRINSNCQSNFNRLEEKKFTHVEKAVKSMPKTDLKKKKI